SYTPYTIDTAEKLRESVSFAAEKGYSVDNQEYSTDLVSVAAPIRNYRGRVIACIAITSPSLRSDEAKIAELGEKVKSTALKISQSMGYSR
ncbi:MAG TPA: IclR family transcriptional regulator, partial [Firmicutes bacterium]|nr:IclR family transcriptional regulator [Bacillota bacterium]